MFPLDNHKSPTSYGLDVHALRYTKRTGQYIIESVACMYLPSVFLLSTHLKVKVIVVEHLLPIYNCAASFQQTHMMSERTCAEKCQRIKQEGRRNKCDDIQLQISLVVSYHAKQVVHKISTISYFWCGWF